MLDYERVAGLMAGILQRDVDLTLTLDEDGGVTPMEVARFVMACESSLRIAIMDEHAAEWKTLGDACATIEAILESGEGEKAIKEDDERTGWYYA